MALTFPLSLDDFFSKLATLEVSFDLGESMSIAGVTGGGEVLTADVGARLFEGSVTIKPQMTADAEAIKAKLDTLSQAGRSFFVYHSKKAYPKADPKGLLLGAAAVKLKTIASNNRDVTLKGLPAGYVLSGGDFMAFPYGSSPVRYALHRLVVGGTASGIGEATVESSSFIRSGAVTDTAVTLIKPACKAVMVPGSVSGGSSTGRFAAGIRFSWRQTLR